MVLWGAFGFAKEEPAIQKFSNEESWGLRCGTWSFGERAEEFGLLVAAQALGHAVVTGIGLVVTGGALVCRIQARAKAVGS